MPIEAVKIPQNVYIEDRIVGPVTLRQLVILLVTGGFSYAIWTATKNQLGHASILATILCWIPFLIGIAFAFVRIQSISLLRFLLLLLEKAEKPSVRAWTPRRGISVNFQYFSASAANEEKNKKAVAQPHRERLEELSALLDQGPLVTTPQRTEPETTPPAQRPVDRSRISVSQSGASSPIDDILEQTAEPTVSPNPPQATGMLQDIFPSPPNTQPINQ